VIFSGAGVDERTYFSRGLMPLSDPSGEWGFVDKSFHWIILPQYKRAGEFSDGLAYVRSGLKWGFIDKSGHEVIPPKYDMTWAFSDGFGRVRIDVPTGEKAMTVEGPHPVYRELYGFVDREGREVIRPQFAWATDFQEDRALVKPEGSALESVIDKRGILLHEPRFEDASQFCQGLAAVRSGGKWGYIDHSGSWAIEPRFISADSFWHGLARVAWENHRGYIDRTGRVAWMLETK
jgi:WG containing repeat